MIGTVFESTSVAPVRYSTDAVTSRDGTTIGYRQLGSGPGLLVLHGGMESAASHMRLAAVLADAYTVYLPDRRGRGSSGPFRPDHTVHTEVEDVGALLDRTRTRFVFGLSSGAIVMLEATLAQERIEKAIIMEPPLALDGLVPADWPERWLPRLEQEIARGDTAAVLVTGMKAAGIGPRVFDFIPRRLLEVMTRRMVAAGAGAGAGAGESGTVTLGGLAPTMRCDMQVIIDTKHRLERYREIRAKVLLLGGGRSRPTFLKPVLGRLEQVLPDARRVELPGLGHSAAGNPDDPMTGRGARPDLVASEIRRFLG